MVGKPAPKFGPAGRVVVTVLAVLFGPGAVQAVFPGGGTMAAALRLFAPRAAVAAA